jgi:agmatinase
VTAGFDLIHTYDLDDMGLEGITRKIKSRVGNGPVYISLDIDVADPSAAPASEFEDWARA